MTFDKLYTIVEKTIELNAANCIFKTKDIHTNLLKIDEVRNILEIEVPIIEDISNTLAVSKGSVHAVRLDKSYGITGFKKPVIASLILKRLIESARRKEINKNWIDGGNVNSSLALSYFANKFGGNATFIMSRFFPDYVLDYIKNVGNNSINIIQAPNLELGVERDFYQYLLTLIRKDLKYKQFQPLWHAKFSGEYTTFLGQDLISCLPFVPDYIVLVLGAGSTLEGQAIPIKLNFNNKSKIVIPEHFESSLLKKKEPNIKILNDTSKTHVYGSNWFSNPPKGIPHYVIGPHFDEINPLLKKSVLNEIDYVYRYGERDWKEMSLRCYSNELEIGNSSAANLFVSKKIAEKGYSVLTFIYEPFREFYHGHNLSTENNKDANKLLNKIQTKINQQ